MTEQDQSSSQDWLSIIQQLAKGADGVWNVESINEKDKDATTHEVRFRHVSTDEDLMATVHLENPSKPIEHEGLRLIPTISTAIIWIDTPGQRYPIQDGDDAGFIGALNAFSKDFLQKNREVA